jgi:hypothetical protein
MHFLRELFCDGVLRVFDSDFVVRDGTLYEVFIEHGLEVELEARVLERGGVALRGRRVRWRGLTLPTFGLGVEFRTWPAEDGSERVDITGTLSSQSLTGRRGEPRALGILHYEASHGEY